MASPRVIRRRVAPVDGDGAPQTFDGQVGASSDDAFQKPDDSVSLINTQKTNQATDEHTGFRWTSVTIPGGATIDVAQVGVFISTSAGDEPQHQIRGELTANPGTFTTTANDIDARGRTTATENWDSANLGAGTNEEWEWGASTAGEGNGSNLKDIVQEIIDLGGWSSGNAMVMILEQHTGDALRDLTTRFWDYDDNTFGAKLHIEFTA